MLLQRLKEYSESRMRLPPRLYAEGPVRYIVELDGQGRLLNPRPTDTADPGSPRTKRGFRRLVPQVQRTSGIRALLLADKADYALGYVGEGSKLERVAACHAAFLELVRRCGEATREAAVGAVVRFLESDPLAGLGLGEGFDPSAVMTFRVDGVFPIDLRGVQDFWAAEHDPDRGGVARMQCLVCGQERPVLERLQAKIKGVPGGQSSGTTIIGMNAPAFESYGLVASLNAPTCAACGEGFTRAANELLASEGSRLVIGGAVFVFWTREEVGFDLRSYFADPKPEDVRALLEAVRSGRAPPDVDQTRFYATALSASGGRTVVREWIDTTVGESKVHVGRWFQRQAIVGPAGEEPRPLGVYALALGTVREARDLAPSTPRALLRAALTGAPAPPSLLFEALRRNRAEQRVTGPRAALIKLVLSSVKGDEEDKMVQLDPENNSPGYRCGRLLAVLEAAQRGAIPGAKATIVDRFYGTASSAPASVFSRLLRGAQPHLAKLERDRPGAYRGLQRRLEEILSGLASFPRTLTLEEQGLFALGYYHQRAHDRAQAREAAERRRAGLPVAPEELGIAEIATEETQEEEE